MKITQIPSIYPCPILSQILISQTSAARAALPMSSCSIFQLIASQAFGRQLLLRNYAQLYTSWVLPIEVATHSSGLPQDIMKTRLPN